MTESNTLVYVLDDNEPAARAMEQLLQPQGYRVRRSCSAAACLKAWAAETEPACLLLDLRMLPRHEDEAQHVLRECAPAVVVARDSPVPAIVRVMRAGAVDFLQKPVAAAELLAALARARRLASTAFARRQERRHLQRLLQRLTPREREVMALVVTGRLNKQVASELGTTEKTVKLHRAQLMRKLEVRSLAELVRLADRSTCEAVATPNGRCTMMAKGGEAPRFLQGLRC